MRAHRCCPHLPLLYERIALRQLRLEGFQPGPQLLRALAGVATAAGLIAARRRVVATTARPAERSERLDAFARLA